MFSAYYKFVGKFCTTKELFVNSIKTHNISCIGLYRKYLKTGCEISFKTNRNKLTHIKELSKSNYYQLIFRNSSSMSDTCKIINRSLRKPKKSAALLTYIKNEGKRISDPIAVCNTMNKHFCNIGHKVAEKFFND